MNSVIDFYKQALENVGLYVSKDGFIYSSSDDDKVMITAGGLPMVMPTQKHINSVMEKDENGKYKIVKIIYNPLNEDIIKGDTESLKKTKVFVERRLGHIIASAGEMLLNLASNQSLQRKVNTETSKFLGSLTAALNAGIKDIVDKKSIDNWANIYSGTLQDTDGMISIYLKKSGVHNGVKYNRLATLCSKVYDKLLEADKNTDVFGVKLRNKDITVFRLVFEYLIKGLNSEDNTIAIGSNDEYSPAFVSLFSMYSSVVTRINKILKDIKHVSEESYDAAYVDNLITLDELEDLSKYRGELANIPNELDITRQANSQSKIGAMPPIKDVPTSVVSNSVYPTTAVSLKEANQSSTTDDPLLKALYGGNRPVTSNAMYGPTPMQQAPMMMPMGTPVNNMQQGYYNPPMPQRPMGLNQMISPANNMAYPPQPMGSPFVGMPSGYGMPNQPTMMPNIGNPASYYGR